MGRKLALIIGNSRYDDTGLARLPTADVDVRELANVLRAPEIGHFDEIIELPDMGSAVVRRSIAQFFGQAKKDDLLVFYFSGHGVKDENGQLYLAAKDTELKLLSGTGIEAPYITAQMDRSNSKRQVLILDCCHSGAFAQGAKGAAQVVGTGPAFEGTGQGHVVLTATDSTQYAWEGDQIIGESDKSVFTHYILQGLKTGEADSNGDGLITVDELYEYVFEQVVRETPKQTPGKWSYKMKGDIVVAKNPNPLVRPAILPLELQTMIESPIPRIRAEAVPELEALLHSRHPGLEAAARKALEQLKSDDSRRVSAAAEEALAESGKAADRLARERQERDREASERERRDALERERQEAARRKKEEERLAREKRAGAAPDTLLMPPDPRPQEATPERTLLLRVQQSRLLQLGLVAVLIALGLVGSFVLRRAPASPIQQTRTEPPLAAPPTEPAPNPTGPAPLPPIEVAQPPAGPQGGSGAKPATPKPAGLPAPSGPVAGPAVVTPPGSEQISRLLVQGDDLLKAGKYAEAIAMFEEAARLGNAEAFSRASRARQEQATQVRQRLIPAAQSLDTGAYAEAHRLIEEALVADAKNADATSLRKKATDAQEFERTSKLSAENPFSQRQVEAALRVLSPRRLLALVKEAGTTFILDASEERQFRAVASNAKFEPASLDDLVRLVAPPRAPATAAEWTAPTDRRPMVWIAGGTFQMGSPANEPGREADEAPHVVSLPNGFWMESTEVTYRAFQKFVLANPEWQKGRIDGRLHDGNYLSDWKGTVYPAGRADAPVVHVSWYAAQAYAKWAGKRLPTEAEWEYACRAGRRSAYWWGDSFDAAPSGAASFAAAKNPWGLAAMLGGVWEWTSSLYRNYPFADDGRNDPATQGPRVIRGGSGTSGPNILRSANRNRDVPERCNDLLGFRCVY